MKDKEYLFEYSPLEEKWNIYTHGFGFIASIIGTVMLLFRASGQETRVLVGSIIFGVSLCILYLASTVYHKATNYSRRARWKILDHAAIYVLIAGTYTPLCLVTLWESVGTTLIIVTWSIAGAGILLKLFFIGRFDILSTLLYVAMGWLIVFAYKPLINSLEQGGLQWLFAGGIAYTVGAVLYSIKRIPLNHAIFHVFVLAGSFCHFMVVYDYVLLSQK